MGGNQQGLSKKELSKSLSEVYKIYTNPEQFLSNKNQNNTNINFDINKEVEEIFQLLGTNENGTISINEFIEIMTNDGFLPSDEFLFK